MKRMKKEASTYSTTDKETAEVVGSERVIIGVCRHGDNGGH